MNVVLFSKFEILIYAPGFLCNKLNLYLKLSVWKKNLMMKRETIGYGYR